MMGLPVFATAEDRADRLAVNLPGTVRPSPSEPHDMRLLDLSEYGFMAETDAPLQPGDKVTTSYGAVRMVPARVIWVRDGRAGFCFDRCLTIAEVRAAGDTQTVVVGAFDQAYAASAGLASEAGVAIRRWPVGRRVVTIVAAALASWATVALAGSAALHLVTIL